MQGTTWTYIYIYIYIYIYTYIARCTAGHLIVCFLTVTTIMFILSLSMSNHVCGYNSVDKTLYTKKSFKHNIFHVGENNYKMLINWQHLVILQCQCVLDYSPFTVSFFEPRSALTLQVYVSSSPTFVELM